MTHHSVTGDHPDAEGHVNSDDGNEPDTPTSEETAAVERERDRLRTLVSSFSSTDITSGDWFVKLLTVSLDAYTKKTDWAYFQEKYHGVPADAIVDQRIKMAAKYASIEGGLSAFAYTGAVAATIGSLGGASPAAIPAAVGTVMVDIAYISQLQLRLAYDIAVLYRVPLDMDDPEDLWKLIRVAFTIKGSELAREGAIKFVPALMRPLIKRFYAGPVLNAARGLPFVGKFLLQRNVIKIGIPLVGIPLAVAMNRWTTFIAGRHARKVFRNEARVIESAERLVSRTEHPHLLPWVSWLAVSCDEKTSDDESLLMRHLLRLIRDRHEIDDEELAGVVDLDPEDVWRRIKAEGGDLSDVITAARTVISIDGDVNKREQEFLDELERRCRQP
ncbi:hypothetical protein [Corynebacterium testudinoris]|uniref:EcsC protein family n=1 Tax=Corynebacterium testudinoris TaxID=136857 RepID=A0A0G3HB08_9CORY|nr:hypothetical protein [Corynebacterium testudinoris]AKK08347.1 hypothetical protein CTEST_04500 [Corynebacterium testudinoris]